VSVSLVIQYAERIFVICGLSGSNTFFHGSHKLHDFGNVIECELCTLIFYTSSSEIFIIVIQIQRDIFTMYKRRHMKRPSFLSDFKQAWMYSTGVLKILRYKIFMKIRSVRAGLFHADGRTDRLGYRHDEANSRFFFQFVSAPKTVSKHEGKNTGDQSPYLSCLLCH
jgi:hypothetical protein